MRSMFSFPITVVMREYLARRNFREIKQFETLDDAIAFFGSTQTIIEFVNWGYRMRQIHARTILNNLADKSRKFWSPLDQ
jgi:hypothetical protein